MHLYVRRSMQELEVRFEPPDVFGVPPSKEKVNVVTSISPDHGGVTEAHLGLATPPSQPLSLPGKLMDAPQSAASPTTAFHSLPPFTGFSKFFDCIGYLCC